MSLDIFGSSIAAADQNVMANAAPDLPAGFSEAFDVAWRSGTEFHNSAAYSIAQSNALSEYRDAIRQKTGESLPTLGTHSEANELNDYVSLDDFNAAQAKLKEKYPGLDYLTPLSEGDLNAMTLQRMKRAHDGAAAFAPRETTWGGTAGTLLGSLAGGLTDPVMVATLPLGGAGEAGIALRALEFAAISGGTEAASAALNYGSREAAVPGSSKEIPGEIAAATVFGGVLGAGFGGLAKLLGHGARPLPTSVRDEVNAATSEFQFHATNPFPTAAGEAAARDATVEATTSLVKGETVRAADQFEAGHVADYALAAKAATPEQLATAGERHLRPETFEQVPDVERFDQIPSEADDAASYWDRRVAEASPEERHAMGATDGEKTFKPSYAPPDPLDLAMSGQLNAETADAARIGVNQYYKDVEKHIFGDRAEEWNKLNRQADRAFENMDDAKGRELRAKQEKLEAEVGLTNEHEDLLGGSGLPDTYDPEFWKGLREHLHEIELGREDALHSVAHQVRYLPKSRNWDKMNNSERESVLVIFSALNAEKAAGRDPAKFLKEAFQERINRYGGGADAHEVAEFQMKELAELMGGAIERDAPPVDAKPSLQREQLALPAPNDMTPEQVTKLAADPATESAVLHNLEHIMAEKPDMEFSTQVRQADGSYQMTTQKLSDVLAELDGMEAAGRELEACAAGLAIAAE